MPSHVRLGGLVLGNVLIFLSTPCLIAVINQEDLSGETEQQNLPGSTWQYPNWRRKMNIRVEDIAPLAEQFAAVTLRTARLLGLAD